MIMFGFPTQTYLIVSRDAYQLRAKEFETRVGIVMNRS